MGSRIQGQIRGGHRTRHLESKTTRKEIRLTSNDKSRVGNFNGTASDGKESDCRTGRCFDTYSTHVLVFEIPI